MKHPRYFSERKKQEKLLKRKNRVDKSFYDGVITRFIHPVLEPNHVPLEWRYDLSVKTNPHFIERLGINSVFNSGAIYFEGEYCLMARIEGRDRKSFFAVARSQHPTHGFRFDQRPVVWEDDDPQQTNVYDIRLTLHEDGFIYGIFCSESKDPQAPKGNTDRAVAKAKVFRTIDLIHFEGLKDIVTPSPQQRNVALHPEFVNGKYLLYTRPQDGFIETGNGGGIAYGFIDSFSNPIIKEERILDEKKYHTIYELKNGVGPSPIKTDKGWIHIAHGVRNTASGLRYVLYAFATDLKDPTKVIAKPSGYLMAPQKEERVGDVSNVLFTNGVITSQNDEVFIYYASSDSRQHVAKTTIPILLDYVFHNPKESFRSIDSVKQRIQLIEKNELERNER